MRVLLYFHFSFLMLKKGTGTPFQCFGLGIKTIFEVHTSVRYDSYLMVSALLSNFLGTTRRKSNEVRRYIIGDYLISLPFVLRISFVYKIYLFQNGLSEMGRGVRGLSESVDERFGEEIRTEGTDDRRLKMVTMDVF